MRRLVLLLALLSLAFAPAPFAKAPRGKKPSAMEGSWTQVGDAGGRLLVSRGKFMLYQNGTLRAYDLRFDEKRTPATFDLLHDEEARLVGIYKVEGDTLTVYYGEAQWGRRPAYFEEDGVAVKEVFERVR
jgi:uncharacterized protein (TIGR03067 family)